MLDLIFGGPNYWHPSNDDLTSVDRWREWLETYRDAMLRAGHRYALTFEVMPRTGQPLYLVFGTDHHKGSARMSSCSAPPGPTGWPARCTTHCGIGR